MRTIAVLTAVIFLLTAAAVFGQETPVTLVISTGSEQGTYHRLATEIGQVCKVPITLTPSKGSRENLDNLAGNKANLGIVQVDALVARKHLDNDPSVDALRTLLVLYPEGMHIVARKNNQFVNRFSDLVNKRVASFGGSLITAYVTFGNSMVRPSLIQDTSTFGAAIQLLNHGKIDAVIAVGGQPMSAISALSDQYKLVPFDRYDGKIAEFYDRAVLQYPNLSGTGVPTIGVQSLLMTLDYKTPRFVRAVRELRNCITENIHEFRETTGFHPMWRLVDPKAKSKWPAFEADKPVEAPSKKKK